jgi:hypothetical protein
VGYTIKYVSQQHYFAPMQIKFTQSARRHRIGKARALFVIAHYSPTVNVGEGQDGEDQKIWIGEDDRGLELEVTAIVLTDCLLVTHVMPTDLRKRKKWPTKRK